MPKNVVGRLLNLENELKTVLSICDVTENETTAPDKTVQRSVLPKTTTVCSLGSMNYSKHSRVQQEYSQQCPMKEASLYSQTEKAKVQAHCLRRKISKISVYKPSSAPTSILNNTEEDKCESKRKRPPRDPSNGRNKGEKLEASSKSLTRSLQDCKLPKGAEQIPNPKKKIPADASHCDEDNHLLETSTIRCAACHRRTFDCICHMKRCTSMMSQSYDNGTQQYEMDRTVKESFLRQIKPGLEDNSVISELVRKIERRAEEASPSSVNHYLQKTVKIERSEKHQATPAILGKAAQKEPNYFVRNVNKCAEEAGPSDEITQSELSDSCSLSEEPHFTHARRSGYHVTLPAETKMKEKIICAHPSSMRTASIKHNNKWAKNDTDGETGINLSAKEIPEGEQRENRVPKMELGREGSRNVDLLGNAVGKRKTARAPRDGLPFGGDGYERDISDVAPVADRPHIERLTKNRRKENSTETLEIPGIVEDEENMEGIEGSECLPLNAGKRVHEKYGAREWDGPWRNGTDEKSEKLHGKNDRRVMTELKGDESKRHLLEEWENYIKVNSSTGVLDKLQRMEEESTECKERLQQLEYQLQTKMKDEEASSMWVPKMNAEVSEMNRDRCHEYRVLFRRQEAVYRMLIRDIATLARIIKNNKEKDKRLSEIKTELKRRAVKTQSYQEKLNAEKIELVRVVNKLQDFVEDRESRIKKLKEEINRKEEEVKMQKKLLQEKNEILEDTSKELESIRKNSLDLEEQVKTLRKSIENLDQMHQNLLKERQSFEELVQRMQGDNNKLKEELSNEKDSVLIKNKIIEDQQETIKQLREKSEEAKSMAKKVDSLERLISAERQEKLELQETVERLRWKKEELKQKVKSLEADLLLAPQEVVRDLQKTQIVLHELENQVQIKQKEWESLLQSLVREKEQACSVAAFATKKLMQSTNDFQRQSDAQKKLYKMLTENLEDKKNCIHDATEKMKQGVRFSESSQLQRDVVPQSEEHMEDKQKRRMKSEEKLRCHPKHAGILKRSRDCCAKN